MTITVAAENTLRRIELLTDALLRVVQGATLRRVLSADYQEGCIELVLAGRPRCGGVDASVTVEVHPLR